MAKINFKVGMSISIPKNLQYTTEVYTTTSTMRKLIGSKQKINFIYENGDLSIAGWSWDKRDFYLQTSKKIPPKKIPITHFDPEELVT